MLLFQLFNNPGLIIPYLTALIVAITVHEFSHGLAAHALGDDTAERNGRLTLNPLAHLDILGSLMLLLVGFGWARPVPINPVLIRKGRLGYFLVSFAGILSNILVATAAIIILKILLVYSLFVPANYLIKFLAFLVYIDLGLFVFNLIPIAPLDGYRIFEVLAPRAFGPFSAFIERYGFIVLIVLVFFTNFVGILIVNTVNIFSLAFGVNIFSLAFGG